MSTPIQHVVQDAIENLAPAFVTFDSGRAIEYYSEEQIIGILEQKGRYGMVELIQKIGLKKAWEKVKEWENNLE